MSRYEESTLTPVASPGVVGCGSVWLCVCEHVCGFPMYCTVILFYFSFFFVSFHVLVILSGLCPPWAGRVRISLLLGAGGKLALNVALSCRQTRFRSRASFAIVGCYPDTPNSCLRGDGLRCMDRCGGRWNLRV